MPYSLQADVQQAAGGLKRLKEIADWDNDATPDAGVITNAIAAADALIDSFASKRFTVPFNPVPPIIVRTSAELARIMLARDRDMLTDDMQKRWDELAGTATGKEGWLYRLATGVVTPGGDPRPLKHGTMAVDNVTTQLTGDRDESRGKTGGYW